MSRFNIKDFEDVAKEERFSEKRKANHDRRDRQEVKVEKIKKAKPDRSSRESKGHGEFQE